MRALVLLSALAIAAPTALGWPGRPTRTPPKPPNAGGPPPAWIESQTRSAWLAFGSYCWATACVDMIPPESRPGLPGFRVGRGGTVRVHLGFAARSVTVSIDEKPIRTRLNTPRRIVSWRAARGGAVTVFARAAGDASYVVRLRLDAQ